MYFGGEMEIIMNKKGNVWFWAILSFILVLLILLTILIISNQDKVEKEKEEVGEPTMNLYLMAKDTEYNSFIPGRYYLINGSEIISGQLSVDSFAEVNNLSENASHRILCSSDGFYSTEIVKYFTQEEKDFNSSKVYCSLNKTGIVKLSHIGELNDKIKLNITAFGYYQDVNLCISWTSNIISVKSYLSEVKIPERYLNKVDRCYSLGKSIKDESVEMYFEIKSNELNKWDSLTFYVFDKDLYTDFNYYSEFNNTNLGNSNDEIYIIQSEN